MPQIYTQHITTAAPALALLLQSVRGSSQGEGDRQALCCCLLGNRSTYSLKPPHHHPSSSASSRASPHPFASYLMSHQSKSSDSTVTMKLSLLLLVALASASQAFLLPSYSYSSSRPLTTCRRAAGMYIASSVPYSPPLLPFSFCMLTLAAAPICASHLHSLGG